MALSICALLFVLGIMFMHSIFGLFSGLIDLICCIAAMVVAFGFFEPVNDLITKQGFDPSYTLPVCFVLLFAITHVVLRLAADNVIRGNVRLPQYVDWGGGAVCGFFIAQITVGVLMIGFLMLPWGGAFAAGDAQVLTYARYQRADGENQAPAAGQRANFTKNGLGLFLKPDEFVVGMFNMFSRGSLSAGTTLASVYPDFSDWVFWTTNTVQDESATSPRRDDKGNGWGEEGLKVVEWWWDKGPIKARYRWKLPTKLQPLDDFNSDKSFPMMDFPTERDKRLLGTRLKLMPGSADPGDAAVHRFRCTMLRVVGDVEGEPRQYHAEVLGGVDPGADTLRLADIDNNFALPAGSEVEIDAYFAVDEGFTPHFVEYRRFARAPLTGKPSAAAPAEGLILAARDGATGPRKIGIARFIDAIIEEGTGDKPQLPFAMSSTAMAGGGDKEVYGGKFKSGRVTGFVDTLKSTGPGGVTEFSVPEGKRLFQLRCKARKAASLAGKVFNYVASVANQYQALDSGGNEYKLVGYYAIVKREGKDFLELYVVNDIEAPAFRGMLDFKDVKSTELRADDSILGLLFYVNTGIRITEVKNQEGDGLEFPGYQMGQ